MKRRRILTMVALGLLTAFCARTARAQSAAELDIINALPDTAVVASVDGTQVISGLAPGDVQDLTELDLTGRSVAELVITTSAGTPIAPSDPAVVVPDAGTWTLMVHLDADANPATTMLRRSVEPVPESQGRLVFRHAAAAPPIDIVTGSARLVAALRNGASIEFSLPAGTLTDLRLALAGEQPIVDLPIIELGPGQAVTVYAIGSLDGETFDFLVTQSEVGTTAATPGTVTGSTLAHPGRVNTGEALERSTNITLVAIAIGLLTVAACSLLLRRRFHGR